MRIVNKEGWSAATNQNGITALGPPHITVNVHVLLPSGRRSRAALLRTHEREGSQRCRGIRRLKRAAGESRETAKAVQTRHHNVCADHQRQRCQPPPYAKRQKNS